jgi:hypothetical protein
MDRDNKRSYFRVDILMPVKWQTLNINEIDLVEKGLGCNLLTQNYLTSPVKEMPGQASPPKKDDQFHHSLQLLNSKLDFIISSMCSESEASSESDRVVEISAAGLKFRTSKNMDTGVFLKMHLIIPGASYVQIELISEVMRTHKIDNGYQVAANIICIDDEARDFLIKMIFQKHRIDIRRVRTNREVC